MIKTRIKKIENQLPKENQFGNVSNQELKERALMIRIAVHKRIGDVEMAREYKRLFIDNPTVFDMLNQKHKTPDEMLSLLMKQRDWEVKHAETKEAADLIDEQYEKNIKNYKFFKKI